MAAAADDEGIWAPELRAAFQEWVGASVFSPDTAGSVVEEMEAVLQLLASGSKGGGASRGRQAASSPVSGAATSRAALWARLEACARQPRLRKLVVQQRGARGQWSLRLLAEFCCHGPTSEQGPNKGAKRKRKQRGEAEDEEEAEEDNADDGATTGSAAAAARPGSPGGLAGGFLQDTISSAFRRWLEAPDPRTGRGRISSQRSFDRYARDAVPRAVREWFWVAKGEEAGCEVDVEGASIQELREMALRTRGSLETILRYHQDRLVRERGEAEGKRGAQFMHYLRLFLGLDAGACVVVLPLQFEEEFSAWLRDEKGLNRQGFSQTVATFRDQLQTVHPADCPILAEDGGNRGLHMLTPLEIVRFLNAQTARREARVKSDPTHGRPPNIPPSHRYARHFIEWKVAARQRLLRERQAEEKGEGEGGGEKEPSAVAAVAKTLAV